MAPNRRSQLNRDNIITRSLLRDLGFLYGLPAKVALVIEKPNENSNDQHRQNQPDFYCGEVS